LQLFFIFTTNFLKLKHKNMQKKGLLGIAISVAVLFGTVWIIGKAWQTSQKK